MDEDGIITSQKIVTWLKARKIAQEELVTTQAKLAARLESDRAALLRYEEKCAQGIVTTEDFNQIMSTASFQAKNYAFETKGAAGSTEIFVAKQKQAQAQLRATTSASNAATIATKALASALNTLVILGITTVISKIVNHITKLDERAQALTDTLDDFNKNSKEGLKTLEELSSEYDRYRKHVNLLGENISLTNEEHEDYLNICAQIAEIMPSMVSYYNDENQAIIDTTKSLKDLTEEYKRNMQVQAQRFLTFGDDEGNTVEDIFKQYEKSINGDWLGGLIGAFGDLFDGKLVGHSFETALKGTGTTDALKQLEKALEFDAQELQDVIKNSKIWGKASDYWVVGSLLTDLGYSSKLNTEDVSAIKQSLAQAINTVKNQQANIDTEGLKKIIQEAFIADESRRYFEIQNKDLENALNKMLQSIDYNFIKEAELTTMTNVHDFADTMLTAISNESSTISEALLTIFDTDSTANQIQDSLNALGREININPNTLAKVLGVEDILEAYVAIEVAIDKAINSMFDFQGKNWNLDERNILYTQIKTFFDEQSVNTQNEVATFTNVLEESGYDLQQAFTLYKKIIANLNLDNEDVDTLSISTTIENLNTKLKPVLDSLASAYQNIFTSDGFTLENVGNDMLHGIKSALEELNSIDGIEIKTTTFEDFVKILVDTNSTSEDVQGAFDSLVTELIEVTGSAEFTTETFNTLVQVLEEMGVSNARELLTIERDLVEAGYDLSTITVQQVIDFAKESDAIDTTREALLNYIATKVMNKPIETEEDIENLEKLCQEFDVVGEAYVHIARLREHYRMLKLKQETGVGNPEEESLRGIEREWGAIQEILGKELELKFKFEFEPDETGSGSTDSWTSSLVDGYEIAVDRIEHEIDQLDKKMDDSNIIIEERNKLIEDQIDEYKALADVHKNAADDYLDKFNGVEFSTPAKAKTYKELIEKGIRSGDGTIKFENETDEEAFQQAEEYFDKYQASLLAMLDVKPELQKLLDLLKEQPETTTFDWIERKIEKITRAIEKYEEMYNNTFLSYGSRKSALLDERRAITEQELPTRKKHLEELKKQAEEFELSDEYKKLVRLGGNIANDQVDEDTAEKINEYKELIEKINEESDAIENCTIALRENYEEWFNLTEQKQKEKIDDLTTSISDLEHVLATADFNANMDKTAIHSLLSDQYMSLAEVNYETAKKLKKEYDELLELDDVELNSEDMIARLALIEEYKAKGREAELKALEEYASNFDEIKAKHDRILAQHENEKNTIETELAKAEAQGYINTANFYNRLMEHQLQTQEYNKKKLSDLLKEQENIKEEALDQGIEYENSDKWHENQQAIAEVNQTLKEGELQLIEYNIALRQIKWDVFDFLQEQISLVADEAQFLIDLFGEMKQFDDKGQLTDIGMSVMGQHAVKYETYLQEAKNYAKELADIEKDIANNPYDTNLIKRKNEILKAYQDNILAAEGEKQAVIDMVEEGINLELESLNELIQSYKDALRAQKD